MAYSIDLTAALKVSKQDNRSKPADFPSSSRDMSYNFKDSLKDAVRDRGIDERKNNDSTTIRKDLVNRAESKLMSLKKPESKSTEAEKPVEENPEEKTDKLKKSMEELLSKLEELSKLQQGELPAEKHISLLESIKETLKELETMQGHTETKHAELQSKTSELEVKLEAILKELKSEGSLTGKEAGNEFSKELKALVSDTFEKLEAASKTPVSIQRLKLAKTEDKNSIDVTSTNQAAADSETVKSVVTQTQQEKKVENLDNKLASDASDASDASEASEASEKQEISTQVPAAEAKTTNKATKPETDETSKEVKTALDSKVQKVTAEDKDTKKQDADAEGGKETPKQAPKTVNTTHHKQANGEIAAMRVNQAAADNVVEEVQNNIPAPKAETVSKAEVINQIVKKAEVIITDTKQEMRMQLEPENLGKLTLKLAVEKGLVTAKFVAESYEVKQVIESSLNELKDMLQEKGLEVQNFSVSVGQDNKGYSNENAMHQWKETVKLNSRSMNKVNYDGYETDEAVPLRTINPYNIHNGKFDHKA